MQLNNKLLIFDGAMGTMLQAKGFIHGIIPEELNIDNPKLITEIHKEYISHGAQVITTNTFGANAYKLSLSKYSTEEIIETAIDNAKAARENTNALIALDIGPIGKIMRPIGDLNFDTAYEYFKEQVIIGKEKNVDIILIETMSDLGEMRAAVLAAKENTNCPVFATMTFEQEGITLTGTDPEDMILALEAIGADVIGVNCSLGPKELLPIVRRILNFASVPVMVQANAGLPTFSSNKTAYGVKADEFQNYYRTFVNEGVHIIGGCCGTTPEFIQKLSELKEVYRPDVIKKRKSYVSSSQKRVCLDGKVTVIGERINPSGNKKLKPYFQKGDVNPAVKLAFSQIENGAEVLDINTSLPGVDENQLMQNIIDQFNGLIDAPLQFDTINSKVMQTALRHYNGVAIVNSVNGKLSSMEEVFPIAKKYGAYVVALTFDEDGIPKTWEKRVEIAKKLIETARKYDIEEEKLIIDCLVLTASAQQEAVEETLKAIQYIKSKYNVKTTLGVSNVSFGLPNRKLLNRTYRARALAFGLDIVIVDPEDEGIKDTLMAFNVLYNYDQDSVEYLEKYSRENRRICESNSQAEDRGVLKAESKESKESKEFKEFKKRKEQPLHKCLLQGDIDETRLVTKKLLKLHQPLRVVNHYLIKSLDEIGRQYEEKIIYLPQLIRAAETAGIAFELVRESLNQLKIGLENKGTIILATVQGDVHDIGKNLVKALLESYGYIIIDLGKDVKIEKIIETVGAHDVKLVGLSALMTTTVLNMEKAIISLKHNFKDVKVFVGGAVLTEKYAMSINADFYGKDAKAAVDIANRFFRVN